MYIISEFVTDNTTIGILSNLRASWAAFPLAPNSHWIIKLSYLCRNAAMEIRGSVKVWHVGEINLQLELLIFLNY